MKIFPFLSFFFFIYSMQWGIVLVLHSSSDKAFQTRNVLKIKDILKSSEPNYSMALC